MKSIYSIHLKDRRGDAILFSSLLYSNPPLSNHMVLQKDQPPPGWSFCLF
jgi:hypothetical protein